MKKQTMTLVFAFSERFEKVVLIRKKTPAWQSGRLNGVGGKVEPHETPRICAQREFFEETGIGIECELYRVGKIEGTDWEVIVYAAESNDFLNCKTQTEEPIEIWDFNDDRLYSHCINNVPPLMHLCKSNLLNMLTGENFDTFTLHYS